MTELNFVEWKKLHEAMKDNEKNPIDEIDKQILKDMEKVKHLSIR